MLQGSIKFFNDVKGFGFITPENDTTGKNDIFFHFSGMKSKGEVTKGDKGKKVTYELKEGKNGPEADQVVITK